MLRKFDNENEWLAARAGDITSTELAALFGLSPYKSRLQLWREKAGLDEAPIVEGDAVEWGKDLQTAVGMGICKREGWDGYDLSLYYYSDPVTRTGSSMDIKAICSKLGTGCLEIKTTERLSVEAGWTKNEVPTIYEFQIQGQLHEAAKNGTPFDWAAVGVLAGRMKHKVYPRKYDADLGKIMDDEAMAFWDSIKAGDPPPPDYTMDGDLLARLRKPLIAGDTIILSQDNRACELVAEYIPLRDARRELNRQAKALEKQMDPIEVELLDKMGRNEYAKIGDYRISAKKIVVEDRVTYGHERRNFSVSKNR